MARLKSKRYFIAAILGGVVCLVAFGIALAATVFQATRQVTSDLTFSSVIVADAKLGVFPTVDATGAQVSVLHFRGAAFQPPLFPGLVQFPTVYMVRATFFRHNLKPDPGLKPGNYSFTTVFGAIGEEGPGGIVFTSDRAGGGNWDIYSMNLDGTGLQRLTNHPANDGTPASSPDGTKIAFNSQRSSIGEVIDRAQIWVMNRDGTNQTNISNNNFSDCCPTWSPDGSKMAFVSNRDGFTAIWIMNADGSSPNKLINGEQPAWSPGALKIAYVSHEEGSWEIYVVDVTGSNKRRLTDTPTTDGTPAWSPDGAKIAYASDTPDGPFNQEIWVMNADGSNKTRLTNRPGNNSHPAWSPDGTLILFRSEPSHPSNLDIWVMRADGSNQTRVTFTDALEDSPAWLP